MKNKILKAGIIILVVIVLLIALCGYFLKTLAEPENIKKYLLPEVSNYLGRDVDIKDIDIGLFSGIALKGISIKEDADFGKDEFIKIDSVVLNFSFLELLQKKLILKNVYFKSLQIKIIRNAEGKFNYSEILNNLEGKKEDRKKESPSVKKKNNEEQPFIFSIGKIITKDGEIAFIDKSAGEKERRYKLKDLNVSVKGKLTEGALKIALRGMVVPGDKDDNGFPLGISGTADLQNKNYSFDVESGDINLYSIIDAVSPENASDMIALKDASAEWNLSFGSSNYEKEAVIKGVVSLKVSKENINIPVSLKLNAPFENPMSDFSLKLSKTSILTLNSLLPQSARKNVESVKIKNGVISGEMSYRGTLNDLEVSGIMGSIFAEGVRVDLIDYGNMPVEITAKTTIEKGKVKGVIEKLKVGNSILSANAESLIPEKNSPLKVNIKATAGLLDIDEISETFGESPVNDGSGKENRKKEKGTRVKAEKRKKSSTLSPVDISFILSGKKIKYSGLPVTDLKMRATYVNSFAVIENLSFNLGKGKMELKGDADLSKSSGKIKGKINADDISITDLKPLLFSDFAGSIDGNMTLVCDFSARGIDAEKIMKTIRAKGKINAGDLIISGVEFLDKTASFLGVDELRNVSFTEGESDFAIENEEIDYRAFKLNGQKLRVTSDGKVAFDGVIKGTASLKISPEFSQSLFKGKTLSNFIGDKEGWVSVPIKFSGTTESPKIGLEQKAVQKEVIEKGKKALKDELDKILKGNKKKEKSKGKKKKKNSNKKEDAVDKGLEMLKDIFN